jgi:hypothetical protein
LGEGVFAVALNANTCSNYVRGSVSLCLRPLLGLHLSLLGFLCSFVGLHPSLFVGFLCSFVGLHLSLLLGFLCRFAGLHLSLLLSFLCSFVGLYLSLLLSLHCSVISVHRSHRFSFYGGSTRCICINIVVADITVVNYHSVPSLNTHTTGGGLSRHPRGIAHQ